MYCPFSELGEHGRSNIGSDQKWGNFTDFTTMFNAKYGLCIYSFELVYQHDIYIYSSYNIVLLVVSTPLKKKLLWVSWDYHSQNMELLWYKPQVEYISLLWSAHTICAYAQCLRSTYHMCLRTMLTQHVLDKTLTPPCANQGFAYAKCSYDRALFPNNSNRFFGVAQMFKSTLSSSGIIFPLQLQTVDLQINGHSRILNWRYLPYIRPIVQA